MCAVKLQDGHYEADLLNYILESHGIKHNIPKVPVPPGEEQLP